MHFLFFLVQKTNAKETTNMVKPGFLLLSILILTINTCPLSTSFTDSPAMFYKTGTFYYKQLFERSFEVSDNRLQLASTVDEDMMRW